MAGDISLGAPPSRATIGSMLASLKGRNPRDVAQHAG